MARAKVMLTECLTYTLGRKTWKRRIPEILTNPTEIERYRMISEFTVTDLKDAAPKKRAKPEPAPVEEDEGTEDEDTKKPVAKKKSKAFKKSSKKPKRK